MSDTRGHMRRLALISILAGFAPVLSYAKGFWLSPLLPPGAPTAPPASLQTYEDEIIRDFLLKSLGELRITNLRGSIQLTGWTQDRIRVRAKRIVRAKSSEEGKRLLGALDLRYEITGRNAELSAEYGRGLDIESRLQERRNPHTRVDLEVQAPASLAVRLWSIDGAASVKDWNAPLDVRTSKGAIDVTGVRSSACILLCPLCDIQVTDVRGGVRVMGGQNPVKMRKIKGGTIYVETREGMIDLEQVEGEQLYVTQSGKIDARSLGGQVEFHSDSGAVTLRDVSGFLSGRSEVGGIFAHWVAPSFRDRALIESLTGRIELVLPRTTSAEVDFWSLFGKSETDLEVKTDLDRADRLRFGPEAPNRIRGRIGRGGELLRVFSERGDVKIRAD